MLLVGYVDWGGGWFSVGLDWGFGYFVGVFLVLLV